MNGDSIEGKDYYTSYLNDEDDENLEKNQKFDEKNIKKW